MIRRAIEVAALFLALTTPAFAQAIPVAISTPTPLPRVPGGPQIIAGRIGQIDRNAGTFSVKTSDSKKTFEFAASDGIDLKSLRRGEKVVVLYVDGTALRVQKSR